MTISFFSIGQWYIFYKANSSCRVWAWLLQNNRARRGQGGIWFCLVPLKNRRVQLLCDGSLPVILYYLTNSTTLSSSSALRLLWGNENICHVDCISSSTPIWVYCGCQTGTGLFVMWDGGETLHSYATQCPDPVTRAVLHLKRHLNWAGHRLIY